MNSQTHIIVNFMTFSTRHTYCNRSLPTACLYKLLDVYQPSDSITFWRFEQPRCNGCHLTLPGPLYCEMISKSSSLFGG